jgi:tRNA pseudouridine55 synthase
MATRNKVTATGTSHWISWRDQTDAANVGPCHLILLLSHPRPSYSALKIDGKPLYEYARQNKPLPRPIEARKVTISRVDLTKFAPTHSFRFPSKVLDGVQMEERKKVMDLVEKADGADAKAKDEKATGTNSSEMTQEVTLSNDDIDRDGIPPIFELEMTVSGGTYVRSVVHDLGLAVGSAAHVVVLTRVQQGPFMFGLDNEDVPNQSTEDVDAIPDDGALPEDPISEFEKGYPCVDWNILERAVLKWENDEEIEVDEEGWAEWEREILRKWPKQGEWKGLEHGTDESPDGNTEVVT